MALNCGGRPPDDHNPKAGLLVTEKSTDMNMAMTMEPTKSTTIFGAHESTGHHMMFAGGSSSSAASYGRSASTSHGHHYIGTMSSYGSYSGSAGQAAGAGASGYNNNEYESAPQLQLGRSDHYYYGQNLHLQQHQLTGGAPAIHHHDLQDAEAADHYHHRHHRLHSNPLQDQKLAPRSSAVFNMPVQAAGGGELHEHRAAYYKLRCDRARKIAPARKVEDARGQQDGDDEEDEDEGADLHTMQEEQSMQYKLEVAAAPGRGYSHGELAAGAPSMSTSSGGGDSMSMSMMMMKKRRLTNEQVRSLEVTFERESKLEPERKNELAMELGLQPRQVAVWFQNRRARFKTKQLERDFDLLKQQYDAVRSEKDKLQAQVARLKDLLDAQLATSSKGNTPTTSSEKQGMDDDMSMPHSSPRKTDVTQSMDDNVDIQATMGVMLQKAKVFSSKGPITLEVKPSLQVPHINNHRQVYKCPQEISNTFSPPTKLSLCSPQQLFLQQMVSMRMEGNDFNPPYHEPPHNLYNQENNLNENEEEEYRSFDSAWHHDP